MAAKKSHKKKPLTKKQKQEKEKRSRAAKKAWKVRKAEAQKRSEIARKGWKTRRKRDREARREAERKVTEVLPRLNRDLEERRRILEDRAERASKARDTAYKAIVENLTVQLEKQIRAELGDFTEVHLTDEEIIGKRLIDAEKKGDFQEMFDAICAEYADYTAREIYTMYLYHPTISA